jgi:hypothetical protein
VSTGNITGGNLIISGTIEDSGQLDIRTTASNGNIVLTPNGTGNVNTGANVSVTGNVTGSYFIGNGSALTGISGGGGSSISNGTSNVVVAASSNVTVGVAGTASVLTIASTGIYTTGLSSVTGNITGGNLIQGSSRVIKWTTIANTAPTNAVAGDFWYNSYTGIKYQYTNDGTGNVWVDQSYPTSFSTLAVTGNITAGNLSVATGNIISGNLIISGAIQDSGQLDIQTTAGNGNIVLTPNGTGNVNIGGNIMPTANATANIGSATLSFNTIFAKATSAQYADLAEMYVADQNYPAGTVVEFGGKFEITVSTQTHSPRIAGVISTNPSYLMNSTQLGEHVVPVALTGRVPCRVVGTIHKGDRLVAGTIAGVAIPLDRQLYDPGCIIGKALEDYDSIVDGIIEIAVGRY